MNIVRLWVNNYREHVADARWCPDDNCQNYNCVLDDHIKIKHDENKDRLNYARDCISEDYTEELEELVQEIKHQQTEFVLCIRDFHNWEPQADLDITHYIHHFAYHSDELFLLSNGQMRWFSQEDMEKLGDLSRQRSNCMTSRNGGWKDRYNLREDSTNHIRHLFASYLRLLEAKRHKIQQPEIIYDKTYEYIISPVVGKFRLNKSLWQNPM